MKYTAVFFILAFIIAGSCKNQRQEAGEQQHKQAEIDGFRQAAQQMIDTGIGIMKKAISDIESQKPLKQVEAAIKPRMQEIEQYLDKLAGKFSTETARRLKLSEAELDSVMAGMKRHSQLMLEQYRKLQKLGLSL